MPELVPIRYGRMAVSPFTFYRGAAAVMAADLAAVPRTGITVQACGDAHLANFGFFASPERRLVFDINDFDETLPGPWEWDVKRLAASLEIAARDRGFTPERRQQIVTAAGRTYREAMRRLSGMTGLDVWYAVAEVEAIRARYHARFSKTQREKLKKGLGKVRSKDNLGALGRFCITVDGRTQIAASPPLIVPVRELYSEATLDQVQGALGGLLDAYAQSLPPERRVLLNQYRFVDIARKVVGVGSVGTRSWMILMLGRDEHDPLFLQAKEAGPSVLEQHLGPAAQDNAGARVVTGQRVMQTVGDIFLGWVRVSGIDGQERDFYIRQLRDWKGSFDIEASVPSGLEMYAELCGGTLARAHARSGDREAIAAYLGSSTAFERALVRFSDAYANQNERDHRRLVEAIADGHVMAEMGI